jgi:hypothetical protein
MDQPSTVLDGMFSFPHFTTATCHYSIFGDEMDGGDLKTPITMITGVAWSLRLKLCCQMRLQSIQEVCDSRKIYLSHLIFLICKMGTSA